MATGVHMTLTTEFVHCAKSPSGKIIVVSSLRGESGTPMEQSTRGEDDLSLSISSCSILKDHTTPVIVSVYCR